jgi:LacI family transcriptional regulator
LYVSGEHHQPGEDEVPPASIKDVAAHAGVSVGTVSNVLNRPHTVSGATRLRVEESIAALGFIRNESARHLRAGRSRTLTYLMLDASNPFFTDVARGIEEVAAAEDLTLFLCTSNHDPRRESAYLDSLLQQRVLGVFVTPAGTDGSQLTTLVKAGIKVILLDRATQPGFDGCSISVNDVEGGELAVTHLLELGHERVAFIGGPPDIVQIRDRLTGARQGMVKAGQAADQVIVLLTRELTVTEGRRAGERLLGLPASRRPTAVFCANDLLAMGFLQEMTRQGVTVPGDVAIVGYDDIEFASAAAVPLTSVRQPRRLLGRTAAELLRSEVNGEPHEHQHVVFTPELVVRESTRGRHGLRAVTP